MSQTELELRWTNEVNQTENMIGNRDSAITVDLKGTVCLTLYTVLKGQCVVHIKLGGRESVL